MEFKDFLMGEEQYANDFAVSTNMPKDRGLLTPSELGLVAGRPITGKIFSVLYKKNPIEIGFMDAEKKVHRAYLSLDEFNRVKPQPAVGRMVTIIFQGGTEHIDKIIVQG